MRKIVLAISAVALLAGGCSTRPREYRPVLAMPAASPAGYEADLADCRALVASGKRSGFGPAVAATGTGVAVGTGVGAAAFATGAAPVGLITTTGAATAAAATLVLMPLAGIAAGIGVTKAIRKGKEKKINAAMTECLAASGHQVGSWELARKARRQTASPSEEAAAER